MVYPVIHFHEAQRPWWSQHRHQFQYYPVCTASIDEFVRDIKAERSYYLFSLFFALEYLIYPSGKSVLEKVQALQNNVLFCHLIVHLLLLYDLDLRENLIRYAIVTRTSFFCDFVQFIQLFHACIRVDYHFPFKML